VGQEHERRRWHRLELAIPVFVRATDAGGRAFTELAVALNISYGGALVALRHPITAPCKMSLEVPRPPIPDLAKLMNLPPQTIEANVVRVERKNGSQLLGLQFASPITAHAATMS
jgi:hypothetical protein